MAKHSWGYDTRIIDTNVRPQDDFYHYANGTWLRENQIPANESRWGMFMVLRHRVDRQLRIILNELSARKRVAPGSSEQLIRDFFRSGMDMKRRNELGISPLAPFRKRIQNVRTHAQLQKLIADFHRLGVDGPWDISFDTDYKSSNRYMLYLGQGGLGMPDRDYYLLDTPEQVRVRSAYVLHIVKMLHLAGHTKKEAERMRDTIMEIETKLAGASMSREDLRDVEKIYNKYTLAKLKKLVPSMDWDMYFKVQGTKLSELVVCQPEFLKLSEELLRTLSIEDWQTYFEWHLVNSFGGYLSAPFVRQLFSFYGTTLAGTKIMRPLWRRVLGTVSGYLGEALGQIYVEKHFSEEAKQRVNELVDDLVEAYEARLKALPWMSSATKRKAIQKLRAMNRKLGYPDKWKSYKGLRIDPADFFGNVLRAGEYEHKRMTRKFPKPVDRSEWYDVPQTVNAFYAPNLNDMLFPAAFLQPPFFDLSADDAVNYGSMGSVIGHEITHGFDDEGCKFDKNGNLKSWWTKEDRAKFMKRASMVREQYACYEVAPKLFVNGQLTLGENIADLGGASIAYDAYMRRLARTGRKDIDGFTPEQRFFLSFALFDAENCRPEILKLRVLNDTHSPPTCRINGVVTNLPEFYAAWGVKKGDKLYREPKNRAKIW